MKKAKKNNKGFSLVELIVVVLIMAIIAVALAPQVMKWVDKSRQSTDISNYDALVSTAQLAMVYGVPSTKTTITMKPSGSECDNTTFAGYMDKVSPDWKQTKSKVKGKTYTIEIEATTGKITKDAAATTDVTAD